MAFLHQDMGLLLSLPLSGNWGDSLGIAGGWRTQACLFSG